MAFDSIRPNVMRALSALIRIRYGCQLDYFSFGKTSDMTQNYYDLCQRNLGAQFIISKNNILVPVRGEAGELVGFLMAWNAGKLPYTEVDSLTQLLRNVVAGFGSAQEVREFISQIRKEAFSDESAEGSSQSLGRPNLLGQLNSTEGTSKVIQFGLDRNNSPTSDLLEKRGHAQESTQAPEDAITVSHSLEVDDIHTSESANPNIPLLIEADEGAPIRELATEIHQTSERSFMISLQDLSLDSLKSISDLESMGPVTLFIPELSKVPLRIQELLVNYLTEKPLNSIEIKIVSASTQSLRYLVVAGVLSIDFANVISCLNLRWSRQAWEGKRISEAIEFFIRSTRGDGRARLYELTKGPGPELLT